MSVHAKQRAVDKKNAEIFIVDILHAWYMFIWISAMTLLMDLANDNKFVSCP